jgi:arylsulfatase A-like enzyme
MNRCHPQIATSARRRPQRLAGAQCGLPAGSHRAVAYVLALLFVIVALATGCSESNPAQTQPSVVLITLDTTRPDHLAIYGYEKETAPNLTRLASEGQVFDNFVTMTSWTLPTHASLFTGLFPSTHQAHYTDDGNVALSDVLGDEGLLPQFRANRLPDEAVTLAEILQEEGYATFGVGAGPWLKPIFGLAQGFESWDADSNSSGGRRADEVNRLALESLGRAFGAGSNDPFFLFLNYFDPHDPYDAPDDQSARFLDPQPKRNPNSKWPKIRAAYDSEILYMDRHLGKILDHLREHDRFDSSWIVVTSDHGEHFGEHGLEYHGFSLYEGVSRGVLVIKPPKGVSLDVDPSERIQSVDIMPTLLEALGIATAPVMEGQPLGAITHPIVSELFRNPGNVRWKGKRFERELRALYLGNFKLVTSSKQRDRDAGLFDLDADPREKDDLRERRPEKHRAMQAELVRWREALLPPLALDTVENIDPETQRQLEALGYFPKDED